MDRVAPVGKSECLIEPLCCHELLLQVLPKARLHPPAHIVVVLCLIVDLKAGHIFMSCCMSSKFADHNLRMFAESRIEQVKNPFRRL